MILKLLVVCYLSCIDVVVITCMPREWLDSILVIEIKLKIKIKALSVIFGFPTWLCGMGHTIMRVIPKIQARFSWHSDYYRMLLTS